MFDVISFLDNHKVYYRTSGPNCARGGVVIKCPFCGADDPSEHLGWDLTTLNWHCWRQSNHGGRKPFRLIMQLIGCGYREAKEIVDGTTVTPSSADLEELLSKMKNGGGIGSDRQLVLPSEFRPLDSKGSGVYYTRYLEKRGFKPRDVLTFSESYDIRYCVTGRWRGRLIFPIRINGDLVTWTGRTISSQEETRYKTLTVKDKADGRGPIALVGVKDTIWNYDEILEHGARTLVLSEGPLDALKMDVYGRRYGVRGTCLFGIGISTSQASLLNSLAGMVDKFVVLGDEGTWLNELRISLAITRVPLRIGKLPNNVKDPGDLTPKQVQDLAKEFVET